MARYVLWQQAGSYPAQNDRMLIGSMWPVGGIISGFLLTVGTGRIVNVAAGTAAVPMGAGLGTEFCIMDAADTATFAAAPPGGQSRIDLLCAQVRDNTIDSGGFNDWILSIVQGTPATTGSQVAPAVPPRAISLGQITSVGGQANLAQTNILQWLYAPGPAVNPTILAQSNTTASMPANSYITVPFAAASSFMFGGFRMAGSSIVIPVPGLYHADGSVSCNDVTAGVGVAPVININGTSIITGAGGVNTNIAGIANTGKASGILKCNAGDLISMTAIQTNGNTQTMISDGRATFLHLSYAGPSAV